MTDISRATMRRILYATTALVTLTQLVPSHLKGAADERA